MTTTTADTIDAAQCAELLKCTPEQVEALRQQLQVMRAEHQRAQNALIDRISKLEALTFEGAAA